MPNMIKMVNPILASKPIKSVIHVLNLKSTEEKPNQVWWCLNMTQLCMISHPTDALDSNPVMRTGLELESH